MNTLAETGRKHRRRQDTGYRNAVLVSCIGAGLVLVGFLIHWVGGTDSGLTYLVMLPMFAGAAFYGVRGALAVALPAGLLISPYARVDTVIDFDQPEHEWLIRAAVLVAVSVMAGIWSDRITRESRLREEAARIDPTTELPNTVAFVENLRSTLTAAGKTQMLVAAAILRATDLSDIADVTGIDASDRIFRQLAKRLRHACPEIIGVYRFSGSQLGLIVESSSLQGFERVVHTLYDTASTPFEVDGAPIRIEPIIGLGHAGDERRDALELIRRARIALRHAQKLESDWVCYEPTLDDSDAYKTIKLIAEVEAAIEKGEFELHYQPKIRLDTGQLAGAEALARWRRPGGGLVPPGSFMPKLERTSLIDTFSRFVICSAVDVARSGSVRPVSINLAARNLHDASLIEELLGELQRTETPGEAFEIEITEGALMRQPETSIGLLHKLRDYGIGISIDDFGTGYSSFAYLRRLPATNLKIDREFIHSLDRDFRARRLVLAMIECGHALGMTVTAEGVETAAQARIVKELGCDFGQGFMWSPAVPISDFHSWSPNQAASLT